MILITGATGTVGGLVLRQLSAAHQPVKGMARNMDKARGMLGPGFDIVYGDLEKPESLDAALQGVEKVFLVSPSGSSQMELEGNMAQAAKRAGVKHLVKLSVMGASPFSPIALIRWHWEIERMIDETGVPATHLRPNFFMQNMLMHAPTVASEGKIYSVPRNGKISVIDARDIAATAAVVLSEHGHEGKGYDLTGPEALTYQQMASAISLAISRPVEYVPLPEETIRQAVLDMGAEEWLVDDLINYLRYFEDGFGGEITGNVARIAGKRPITFEQFARDYAEIFVTGHTVPRAA